MERERVAALQTRHNVSTDGIAAGTRVNSLFLEKAVGVARRKAEAWVGRFVPLAPTLEAMAARPYELHFELTNLCNANCIFCPYQYQQRHHEFMTEDVFRKALHDFCAEGGGSVFFTPIVGDALIHDRFVDWVRQARSFEEIDRIRVVTNAILVDRFGADAIVSSGLSHITISTAGFDEKMYERVYRSKAYRRMYRNVLELLRANRQARHPVDIAIALRPDRPLAEVMRHPDFQEILGYAPDLDFTWSFTTANGRITREQLPEIMRIRKSPRKHETCVQTYNGPIVLADGTVLGCSCVAAVDAIEDLSIGDVMQASLGDIWRSEKTTALRETFNAVGLNPTCAGCDMYRDLELYRTREGRQRARASGARAAGSIVHRERVSGAWVGG